ncbi:MAG: NAD(P)H-quinone oxidoreductase [Gemmatimonadales bacterium]
MRAIVIREPGDTDVLELREVPLPEPASGHVRVKVVAFGINRADILQRRGMYPAPPGSPGDIPGLEFAGEVDALGADVTGVEVGDRVMGIVGGGSYAEYLVTHASHVVPMPEELQFEEAAAIPEAFITAHDALERLDVASEEWVLVHAVGSGVGTAALQLIGARSARCIGTSRTPKKLVWAEELGMFAGINTVSEEFAPRVRQITGAGVSAAVDLIGGPLFPATIDAMAQRGRVIIVGITAGRRAEVDLRVIMGKRLRIEGTVLRARSTEEKAEVTRSFREQVLPLFEFGTVRPVVDRVFEFDEVPAAHKHMESNVSFGKTVVRV